MAKQGGYSGPLEQVGPCQWRIPKSYRADMRVDGLIFADETLIEPDQARTRGPSRWSNVATLPGIQKASMAMPDIHWGYGFAIGGVAATDPEQGGSDLARRRRLRHQLRRPPAPLEPRMGRPQAGRPPARRPALFRDVPTGVGQSGHYTFDKPRLRELMERGARLTSSSAAGGRTTTWTFTEAGGRLEGADPDLVSDRAYQRG